MNERIKELALQAGEYANSVYTPPVRSKMSGKIWEDGHIDWHELYNEKFAELIVRECINNVLDSTMEYCGRSQIAEELREHFGVEE
jgi:hypothetical protein